MGETRTYKNTSMTNIEPTFSKPITIQREKLFPNLVFGITRSFGIPSIIFPPTVGCRSIVTRYTKPWQTMIAEVRRLIVYSRFESRDTSRWSHRSTTFPFNVNTTINKTPPGVPRFCLSLSSPELRFYSLIHSPCIQPTRFRPFPFQLFRQYLFRDLISLTAITSILDRKELA